MDAISQYGINIEHDFAQIGKGTVCMHEHNVYELYYLVSGKRRYLMQHTVYDVEPGNLILIPPGQLHRVTSATQTGYHRYVLYFNAEHAELLSRIMGSDTLRDLFQKGCIQLPSQISKQIESNMNEIDMQLRDPSPVTYAVITHLLHGILLNVLRFGKQKRQIDGGTADKVQQIAKFISENYTEDINLAMVADIANMERTYFCKRFKAITGIGFQDYLLQIRLQAAMHMLAETQKPVSEISSCCGFSTSNYFGDAFRRYYGTSPTEYRKKLKDK